MKTLVTYEEAVRYLANTYDSCLASVVQMDYADIVNSVEGYVHIRDLFDVDDDKLVFDIRRELELKANPRR